MAKARVLGAVEHQVHQAVLADVAQALELWRVDRATDQPGQRGIGLGLGRRRRGMQVDRVKSRSGHGWDLERTSGEPYPRTIPPHESSLVATARRDTMSGDEHNSSSVSASLPRRRPSPRRRGRGAAAALNQTIGFLGTGNMAEALIRGLLRAGVVKPEQVWGGEPRASRMEHIKSRYGIHVTKYNVDVVRHASVIVLSVKPQILPTVLDEIAPHLKPRALVISVAAGVPIAVIEARLPTGIRVVRTMPNTSPWSAPEPPPSPPTSTPRRTT